MVTVMRRKLSRISVVLSASGLLAAGLASGAYAATTTSTASTASTGGVAGAGATAKAATVRTPAWHTILSVPNGKKTNLVDTVVAAGKTSGWAFLNDGTAYERTGATTWKKVAFPGSDGVVNAAASSSPSDVWAAYLTRNGQGTQLYHWNGRTWTRAKSFPHGGSLTGISVLGPNDVWAFGGVGSTGTDGVFHFNGRTWTEVSATLHGGSALSDKSVWAYNGTQVEFFNGQWWTAVNVVKLLPPASNLTGVIALAPNNIYATGATFAASHGTGLVVLRYNGRTWSKSAAAAGVYNAAGQQFASDGTGGLWAVAETPGASVENPASSLRLLHYHAGRLTAVTVPATAITSVSRIPGTAEELVGGEMYGKMGTSVVLQYF